MTHDKDITYISVFTDDGDRIDLVKTTPYNLVCSSECPDGKKVEGSPNTFTTDGRLAMPSDDGKWKIYKTDIMKGDFLIATERSAKG